MLSPGVGGVLVALALLGSGARAHAQTDDASRASARELGTSGVEAFQQGRFAEASTKLEKAYQVLKVPSIGLWSARALFKLDQLVRASERYREVLRLGASGGDPAVQKQAQVEAEAELAQLAPTIPRVVIKIAGAAPEATQITVDSVPLASALIGESRLMDPGVHVIQATSGGQTTRVDVALKAGEAREVVLQVAPALPVAPPPAPAPPPAQEPTPAQQSGGLGTQRTWALVTGGLGLVGVGLGSYFGVRAKSKLDEANDAGCSGSICPDGTALNANEAAQAAGNISTVAFVVGGLALAGGVALWVSGAPSSSGQSELRLGPGAIQVRTVF